MAETTREKELIRQQIEENRRLERQELDEVKDRNLRYQDDLLGQMQYNNRLRQQEAHEDERIWLAQRDAEVEYRRKLEDALANPQIEKLHPMRRALSGESGGRRSRNSSALQRGSSMAELLTYQ